MMNESMAPAGEAACCLGSEHSSPLRSGRVTSAAAYQAADRASNKRLQTFRSNPFWNCKQNSDQGWTCPHMFWKEVFLKEVINYRSFILEAHSWLAFFCLKGRLRLLHSWCDQTGKSCLKVSKRVKFGGHPLISSIEGLYLIQGVGLEARVGIAFLQKVGTKQRDPAWGEEESVKGERGAEKPNGKTGLKWFIYGRTLGPEQSQAWLSQRRQMEGLNTRTR